MFRRKYSLSKQLAVTAFALAASGLALADGSSMSRFGGESYAYFNNFAAGNVAAAPGWRQSHPNGLDQRDLEALSSSDLSATVARVDPAVISRAPADPAWRQMHPVGLTEREMLARSSSSLSMWQIRNAAPIAAEQGNVAQNAAQTLAARFTSLFRQGNVAQ